MSWAEVKTVNSVPTTTLDIWFKIMDIETYGEKSIILENKDDMTKLYYDPYAINKELVQNYIFDFGVKNNLHIGRYIKNISNINDYDWEKIKTIDDFINDGEALKFAILNQRCRTILLNNIDVCKKMGKTNLLIHTLANVENETVHTDFFKNETIVNSIGENDDCIKTMLQSMPLKIALASGECNTVLQKYQNTFFNTVSTSELFEKVAEDSMLDKGYLEGKSIIGENLIHMVSIWTDDTDWRMYGAIYHGLGTRAEFLAGTDYNSRDDATKRKICLNGSRFWGYNNYGKFYRWQFKIKEEV